MKNTIRALIAGIILAGLVSGEIPMIPDQMSGQVTDRTTGEPLDGIIINITGNVSGLLWSGTTRINTVSGVHGVYDTKATLSWTNGELLTIMVANESAKYYSGSATAIAEQDDYVRLDFSIKEITPPGYSSYGRTPSAVTENTDVTISSVWTDNYAVATVIARHNALGAWNEYATTKSGSTYYYVIPATYLEADEIVGWNFHANDTAGNWNTSMPVQTFIAWRVYRSIRRDIEIEVENPYVNENVTIRVLDADSGRPIKNAFVNVYYGQAKIQNMRTDEDGVTQFTPGEVGEYKVGVEATGYDEISLDFTVTARPTITTTTSTTTEPTTSTELTTTTLPKAAVTTKSVTQTTITGPSYRTTTTIAAVVKPSCVDGVQNQGEEEVDCGGPCLACPAPSRLPLVIAILVGGGIALAGFSVIMWKIYKKYLEGKVYNISKRK